MAHVVPKHPDEHYGRQEPPPLTFRQRGGWVVQAFIDGVTSFVGKLALVTGFVGGSLLTYLIFVTDLHPAWVATVAVAVLLVVFVIGAEQLWEQTYMTLVSYAPTWERCRDQANNLKALAHEHRHDGTRVLPLEEVDDQLRINFRRDYMNGWMSFVEAEYDRACAAGYRPDFDRDRIATAELDDVIELAAALDDVVVRWRAAEGTH